MPVYAVEFRTAPDEQEPLQRCSIDAAVYISLSALPGFLGGSDSQESACSAGDSDSISGSGRSPGEGNGYLLQYSCLKNFLDRGTWRATIHGGLKRVGTTEQLTALVQGLEMKPQIPILIFPLCVLLLTRVSLLTL